MQRGVLIAPAGDRTASCADKPLMTTALKTTACPWLNLRWGRIWTERQTKGWSGQGVVDWFAYRVRKNINPNSEEKHGCPLWTIVERVRSRLQHFTEARQARDGSPHLSGCKQVTASDVISGWNFSGPLADQMRRKNGSPVAITQSGQDVPAFGISSEPWVRLRWGERWARQAVRGWSGRAVAKWFGVRKLQDASPKSQVTVGIRWSDHPPK